METTILAQDLAYGLMSENESVSLLERVYDVKLTKTGEYDSFDFIGDNGEYYELKTRRNVRHNQYPTALWELNKVMFSNSHPETKFNMIFRYSDGYFKCDWDTIKNESFAQMENATWFYRKNGESPSKVIYIPHRFMTKIDC
jgi:hypothetical protein